MSARIKTDDEVIVIGGKDRGKRGKVLRVEPKKNRRLRRGPEHRQAPPATAPGRRRAARRAGRRRDREGGPDPHVQRDADRPEGRQADADRDRGGGRQALPDRAAQRNEARLMATARLKTRYVEEIRPQLVRAVRLLDADAGAEDREDHRQHGRRRRQAGLEDARGRDRAARRRSPGRSRTCAARGSRSRSSRCARACPSASP